MMTSLAQRNGRTYALVVGVVGAGALAAAALLGAGPAQADPPPGWGPGESGIEYDLADVIWSHHGRYSDAPGNWHTGWVNVEEDDDGITGELIDWRCPDGVEPPTADQDQTTACTQKNSLWLEYNQSWNVAQFDQARNRLDVHMDVPAYADDPNTPVRTVRMDLVIKGVGAPEVISDESGAILEFSEIWNTTKSWGHVDGHRVRGPNTTQVQTRMGYWLDGWERTT